MAEESKLDRLLIAVNPAMRTVPAELRLRVWRRLAINKQHRFMYIRIPKAANSTVILTLAHRLFPDLAEQLRSDLQGHMARKLFAAPSTWRRFGVKALSEGLRTFSFFRNPYTRLLSAYLDKLCSDENRDSYQWVAQAAGYKSIDEMTFERFVAYLEQDRNVFSNIHWAPQTAICPIPVEQLDIAGRLEHMEADLRRLATLVTGKTSDVEIVSREQNRQGAANKLQDYYSPALMQRVQRLYEADFRQLQYDPEPAKYLG